MDKLDFRKAHRALYSGKAGRWDRVTVPPMTFLMIDGQGDPNAPDFARAVAALYPLAYGVKKRMKAEGADFTVPPLEATWHAPDPSAFVTGDRNNWHWTAMIRIPDAGLRHVEDARAEALVKLAKKPDPATDAETIQAVRAEELEEGDSLQTLHIGPYTDEAPVLAELHDTIMPRMGLTFGLPHHEIYFSDPRRTAPEKLKTLLRQPVRPL